MTAAEGVHSVSAMSPKSVVLLACVLLVASCGASGDDEDTMGLVARSLEKCGRWSELGTCLRLRAVGLLDRALRVGPIQINDYLTLAPDGRNPAAGRALSQDQIAAALPEGRDLKESALDEMIGEKMSAFFQSRTLKFSMPTEVDEEGRRKKNKKGGGGMGMMMAAFFSMAIQIALSKIALVAGKALIVGKLALVLSAIIGLKKLLSGGESHQVVYAGDHGGHGYGRSHHLAYSAQAPKQR